MVQYLLAFSNRDRPNKATFGQRLRELRKAKGLSQRALGERGGVKFTYISKIENSKLDFARFPSEQLIRSMAEALEADVDELLFLAKKIPQEIREWVLAHPDVFRKLAKLDDETLNKLLEDLEDG